MRKIIGFGLNISVGKQTALLSDVNGSQMDGKADFNKPKNDF